MLKEIWHRANNHIGSRVQQGLACQAIIQDTNGRSSGRFAANHVGRVVSDHGRLVGRHSKQTQRSFQMFGVRLDLLDIISCQ
jgi:hypothetical protein